MSQTPMTGAFDRTERTGSPALVLIFAVLFVSAALASSLPHARRLHSQLVCGLTGREMGDADPPAALPCGATFSESGLRAIAGPDGCVECPLHGGEREGRTPLSQLRRVFVS